MSYGKFQEKRTFFKKHKNILHKTRNKIKSFSEKVRLEFAKSFLTFITEGIRGSRLPQTERIASEKADLRKATRRHK